MTTNFIPTADITKEDYIAKTAPRIAEKFRNDDEFCFCVNGYIWTEYTFELHLDADADGIEGDYSTDIDLADYADTIPDYILSASQQLPDDYDEIFTDWLYNNFMRLDNKIFADICRRLAGQIYDSKVC